MMINFTNKFDQVTTNSEIKYQQTSDQYF